MKDATLDYYNTADLREAARRRLPKGLFEFMDRGNDDEVAMRENRAALARIEGIISVRQDCASVPSGRRCTTRTRLSITAVPS